jgi:hypothetical protein
MRAASLLLVFLSAGPAAAAEDYLLVFTADTTPYKVLKAHTFAAVVRVERAPGCPPRVVDLHSLSWLPLTMKIRGLTLRPETGRNVPLDETLRFYLACGGHVCLWGPYLIRPELAETFRGRVAAVESSFHYKGACVLSPLQVCDCVRSVEEMIGSRRRYIGVFGYGAAAGSVVVRKFSPWLIDPERDHPWVATLIGLDEYPLLRRPFGDYTSRLDQFESWLRRR